MALSFNERLGAEQRAVFSGLTSPARIQAFLDSIPYSAEEANRCPLRVLNERQAHCLDGGLFAAAALRQLGHPPLIVDLLPAPGTDDDHVLAIYRRGGYYGAIAKSNYAGLRFREAVYRTVRELALSYFEQFFNVERVKTLRAYSRPLSLAAYDRLDWVGSDRGADAIEARLKQLCPVRLVTGEMAAGFAAVDERSYRAGMLGADPAGLYHPRQNGADGA